MADVQFTSALAGTVLVISGGYFASFQISDSDRAGLGKFVGTVSLPSLLFNQMATLNFKTINWKIMITALVAKVLLFSTAVAATLVFSTQHLRGDSGGNSRVRFVEAGMNAIIVTQSNDFALGYPLLQSLYTAEHPSWVDLLFLMAPISLVLLNPLGFLLIGYGLDTGSATLPPEVTTTISFAVGMDMPGPRNPSTATGTTTLDTCGRVLKRVVTTPLVFWTFAGVLSNLCFGPGLPQTIDFVTGLLGNAFTPCALFLTGLAMGTKRQRPLEKKDFLVPLILSVAKVLLMPVLNVLLLQLMDASNDMLTFGIIYGAIPTAPSVLVYAQTCKWGARGVNRAHAGANKQPTLTFLYFI
jgi:predicted permease